MKIVVVGGTGLNGSKSAPLLRSRSHEVLQASPSKGVNAATGEGQQAALAGAGRWRADHADAFRRLAGQGRGVDLGDSS